MSTVKWIIIYFCTMIFIPIALPVVLIWHILSILEYGRSRRNQRDIEKAITKALSKQ